MADMLNYLVVMLTVMALFSVAVSLYTHAMPPEMLNRITSFSDLSSTMNLEDMSNSVQGNLERQTKMPVVEMGAIVFYSGNMLLDLFLNFTFAIPEMVGLLIYSLTRIFSIDTVIIALVELLLGVVMIVWYFVSLLQLIIGIRSGRVA